MTDDTFAFPVWVPYKILMDLPSGFFFFFLTCESDCNDNKEVESDAEASGCDQIQGYTPGFSKT